MPRVAARRVLLPPGSTRRAIPRWVGAIVLVLVAAVALAIGAAYWETYRLERQEREMIEKQEQYRRDNAQLRELIRLLQTPDYIERMAREQLGLVKEDEIAVMLVDPPPAPPAPDKPEDTLPDPAWWREWLQRLWQSCCSGRSGHGPD